MPPPDPSPPADPHDPGSSYRREPQHGPEMDDTQVEATGELRDQLDPVPDGDAED
jgi:hypothetical protein